ncbi:hypothetical protein BHE74_00034229 [Ensete ventricosum]|nr:hypothetical protein BHE74_00034229 [Ensete ventricosum]
MKQSHCPTCCHHRGAPGRSYHLDSVAVSSLFRVADSETPDRLHISNVMLQQISSGGERPEKVPTELPELVIGIKLARDVTEEKQWLTYVACHGCSLFSLHWSLRFGFGFGFGFGKETK